MIEHNPLAKIDFNSDLKLSTTEVRELLAYVESQMMLSQSKVDVPVEHHFSKDVYAREIRVPKGTLLMGKIHKFQNLNILSSGEVSVLSIDGVKRVKAPFTFVASPGAKRLFFMHEDTVWTTIHGTGETDIDKIEDEFIAKSYDEVYLSGAREFADVLAITGFTAAEITAISENQDDQTPFSGPVSVEVKPSSIHGQGLFATADIKEHEMIASALIDGKRTPAGRFTNHASKPNAKMYNLGDHNIFLVASAPIAAGEEITTDYFLTFKTMRGQ